jgi:hypothetical protein
MTKAVVRSKPAPSRRCRSCGTSVRPPRWLCSRCELAEGSVATRRLTDTDTQVQALRRNTGKACVSIVSSLDTLLPGSVPSDVRVRWLRALRQAGRAVALVEERLDADSRGAR